MCDRRGREEEEAVLGEDVSPDPHFCTICLDKYNRYSIMLKCEMLRDSRHLSARTWKRVARYFIITWWTSCIVGRSAIVHASDRAPSSRIMRLIVVHYSGIYCTSWHEVTTLQKLFCHACEDRVYAGITESIRLLCENMSDRLACTTSMSPSRRSSPWT